jgi:hypothetical protein
MTGQPDQGELASARALMDVRRWDEASIVLGRLLTAAPQTGALWCLLAECRIGQRNWLAASAAGRTAIALDPSDVHAHLLASWAAGRLKRPQDALALARQAVALAPSDGDALIHLAEVAAATGATDETRRAAERAVAVAPDVAAARRAMGLLTHSGARSGTLPSSAARWSLERAAAWSLSAAARYNLARRGRVSLPPPASAKALGPGRPARSAQAWAAAVTDGGAGQDLRRGARSFLGRAAYLLVVVGWGVWQLGPDLPGPAARLLPVAGLLLVAGYAVAFVRRLEPPLRRAMGRSLAGRQVALAAALDALAVLALLGLALDLGPGPALSSSRVGLLAGSFAAAARLTTYLESRRSIGRVLDAPAPYMLGSGVMWLLAAAMAVLALMQAAGVTGIATAGIALAGNGLAGNALIGGGERIWSVLLAGAFALGALATVGTIVHRIRAAHREPVPVRS